MKLPENTVEITRDAALALIGNDQLKQTAHHACDNYRLITYEAYGVLVFSLFNFASSRVSQYYVQDINV